jgi:hypothetical protein
MSIVSGLSFKAARIPAALFLLTFLITACGGGGGSSTGSGGGATDSSGTIYAGTYVGPGKLTVSGGPGGSATEPFTIVVVIRGDGSVVLDPQTPIPGSGTITGNTISGSYSGEIANSPGISCSGRIGITGNIENMGGRDSGNRVINGRVGPSKINCNNISLNITGSFTASKTGNLKPGGESLGNRFMSAAKQALER